ncbi:hypothetical protein RFI_35734 [Reticulomyxa filosa]|uniref:Uncharacterized protein n=1 Tax=Reticulomyxa filosa TaxID=46433 RepID=X6LLT9_RETFI|nr:hypothetical protein RFI_35734 [Reticulomyxa filosa]|eukprot:ETO01705.1 hypothetical protein RFI_35734 [Reticulomyxa filosa]
MILPATSLELYTLNRIQMEHKFSKQKTSYFPLQKNITLAVLSNSKNVQCHLIYYQTILDCQFVSPNVNCLKKIDITTYLFNEEFLICGGKQTNDCYSYHTLKKEYKFICSYSNDFQFNGHCVVQLNYSQTNPNKIHLLSFGRQDTNIMKQTFSIKYKSIFWKIL